MEGVVDDPWGSAQSRSPSPRVPPFAEERLRNRSRHRVALAVLLLAGAPQAHARRVHPGACGTSSK